MSAFKRLLEQVETLNRREALIKRGDRILVGLSGGPDSAALLFFLSKLKSKYRLRLVAAHLNHGLSKKNSARYFKTSLKLARQLQVPFYFKAVSVRKSAAKHKRSLEESGRLERYRFFESLAKRTGANKVATAHHLDDQAETVLMRLLRGSALRGLRGIPPKRSQGRTTVIRPFLNSRKSDILRYAKEAGIRYCLDPSNRDFSFTRNRVRFELLPHLIKRYNAQLCGTLSNLQVVCGQAQDFLEKEAGKAFRYLVSKKTARSVVLRLKKLAALHPALLREVLILAVATVKGDARRLTHEHVEAMLGLLRSRETDLETHLPGKIVVFKNRVGLRFFKN
ncbi:MAG: tRNA lysidine(34) synthetase TilS [Candidatus Omnitrophica bacterium]|nr:tRNA lysidine(34) synthetase TilS [Candidatus Omnitrophota bacterium]